MRKLKRRRASPSRNRNWKMKPDQDPANHLAEMLEHVERELRLMDLQQAMIERRREEAVRIKLQILTTQAELALASHE